MTTTFPDLRRLRYFHGQLLGAHDFQREQRYLLDKLRLRNRCLHGYGVACGLTVEQVDASPRYTEAQEREWDELEEQLEASEEQLGQAGDQAEQERLRTEIDEFRHRLDQRPHPRVRVSSGVAVDCHGDEIVVPYACEVDLLGKLSAADRRRFRPGGSLYLSIEYCERPVEPTREVLTDGCGTGSDCEHGWCKEDHAIRVTLEPPATDECADGCCEPCEDRRLLLARIDRVRRRVVRQDMIHMELRRPLSRYHYTTITGINWRHDGYYTVHEARRLLGTDGTGGLEVEFSRKVLTSTLVDGVVLLQVLEGGEGRHGYDWQMDSKIQRPADPETDRLVFRHKGREYLQDGDQVLVTVRTAFILDRCCRPVDGTHVGGRVPLLPDHRYVGPKECDTPPSGTRRWTSGTGLGGDVFESWFYIREEARS